MFAALLAGTPAASAQEPELTGWQHQTLAPNVESYNAPGNVAAISLAETPAGGGTPEEIAQRVIAPMAAACPGLAAATPTRADGILRMASAGPMAHCILLVRQGADAVHSAFMVSVPAMAARHEAVMRTILTRRSDTGGAGGMPPPAGSPFDVPAPADLLATLDRVPAAARPVAMVARSSYEVLSGLTVTPWALFGNGVAISGECAAYSPLSGPPTLALVEHGDCDARRWLGSGEALAMIDSDGEAIENDNPAGEAGRFTRGQAVDLAVVMHGHSQIGTGDPYTTTASVSRTGTLRLTTDGRFGGSAARSVQAIGGLVFERPNRRAEAFEGRYAMDGFLIAITDPAGTVTIKPIGLYTEDGDNFVYYEGDVYLEEE